MACRPELVTAVSTVVHRRKNTRGHKGVWVARLGAECEWWTLGLPFSPSSRGKTAWVEEVGAVGLGHARIVPLGPPMALLLYVVHCHGVAAVVQSST